MGILTRITGVITRLCKDEHSQDAETSSDNRDPPINVRRTSTEISAKTSPTSSPLMPRLVSKPSPLLSSSTSPMLSSNPRPVAAVVGNKRPAPVSTPSFLLDIKKEDEEDEDGSNGPVRKRANLDHLSPEERMMRRKLKNRVAAQTARDKKKAATDSMEKQLADLKVQLEESLATTAKLMESNNQLQLDNAALQKENLELQSRLGSLPSHLTLEVLPSSLPYHPSQHPVKHCDVPS